MGQNQIESNKKENIASNMNSTSKNV